MTVCGSGIHHLAIATRDIKTQIEFFTDVLGAELKALYWMHGVKDTIHAFVALGPTCHLAFQQHPANPTQQQLGVTHAGNAGGQTTAGTMQHLALRIDTLDDLYALRDRIRSRGVICFGPINHGLCQSIYFAGPEGLILEVACGDAIDPGLWIDPKVQQLVEISDEELAAYMSPAAFSRPAAAVPQPPPSPTRPQLKYSEARFRSMLDTPDEGFWGAVSSDPPVKRDATS